MPGDHTNMKANLYPALALNTEGDYTYIKNVWRNGAPGKWFPSDGEPGFNARQLTAMRYQHAVIGINTECSELMQLFTGVYLSTIDAPLDDMEAIKEMGDIMWYCSLAYQALFTFVIPTSPRFPASQPGVIRFTDAVNYAQHMAEVMRITTATTTRMDLSVSAQHAANLLLKWFKNACFYGQAREQHEIETQLSLIILNVAKLARLLGYDMSEVLDINIEKLKRRYPEGFNGTAAVAQADEAPGYESISDRVAWNIADARQHMDDQVLSYQQACAAREKGLAIDNTFDQSTLPEPSDKSDIACLYIETPKDEAARISTARFEAVLQTLTNEDLEVLTTVIEAVKKLHTSADMFIIGEEIGKLTSQLYNVATALGWSEPVDHSGNLPPKPLS